MADINYNSGPVNPGYNWKPSGFLAGMSWQQDRDRYMDMAPLQDYATGLGVQSSKAKLEDYFKDAPVRDAERSSKIATADAVRQTILREKMAGVDSSELKNQYERATQPSRIALELLKLPEAERGAQIQQMDHAFKVANVARSRVANGEFPGIVAAELGEMANNPVVQMAMTKPQQYDLLLKDFGAASDALSSTYRNDRQKAIEKMAEIEAQGKNQIAAAGVRTGQEREYQALLDLSRKAAGGDVAAQRTLAEFAKVRGGVARTEGAEVRAAAGAKADIIKDYVKQLSLSRQYNMPQPPLPPGITKEDVDNYLKTSPINVGAPVVKTPDGVIDVDATLRIRAAQNQGK